MSEDNDYFGVNSFNSSYAQDANRRADASERARAASEIEAASEVNLMESDLYDAERKVEKLQKELKESFAIENLYSQELKKYKEISNSLHQQNVKLKSEVEFYESLLSKSMLEIAHQHEGFRETYKANQLLLAEWIVSEMAFAETAYEFGADLGRPKEEITSIYKRNKIAVLLNKTNHGNNAASNDTVIENKEILKEKLIKNAQLSRNSN